MRLSPPHVIVLLSGMLGGLTAWIWSLGYPPELRLVHDATNYYRLAGTAYLEGVSTLFRAPAPGELVSDPLFPLLLSGWFHLWGQSVEVARSLGMLIFGISVMCFTWALHRAGLLKQAPWLALLYPLSPVLSSFASKVYSESLVHLGATLVLVALCGRSLERPPWTRAKAFDAILLALGALLIVLTKAAFFPWVVGLTFGLLLTSRYIAFVPFALVAGLAAVSFMFVTSGPRGTLQLSSQAAKVELLSPGEILSCGVYNLSREMGRRLIPELEGTCALNYSEGDPRAGGDRNFSPLAFKKVDEGFTTRDYFRSWMEHPFEHALVSATSLCSAVFIEGIYPSAIAWATHSQKTVLWLVFTVGFSVLLWGLAFYGIGSISLPGRVFILSFLLYALAFHANAPAEKRHFFPMLSFLYFSAGYGILRLKLALKEKQVRS